MFEQCKTTLDISCELSTVEMIHLKYQALFCLECTINCSENCRRYVNSAYWCRLLMFVNILDSDQARQNVRPDLDPNCLTLIFSRTNFLNKFSFFLIITRQKNYPVGKEF